MNWFRIVATLTPGFARLADAMDAGGRLPAFILNRAAVDNPYKTLRGLARYAEANRAR